MQNVKNPAVKINISTGKICQDCETSRCLKDTERLKDIHEVLPVLTVVRAVRVDFVVVVGGGLVVLEDVCVASWIISFVFDVVVVILCCVTASGVGLVWLRAGTRVPTATGSLMRGVLAGPTGA